MCAAINGDGLVFPPDLFGSGELFETQEDLERWKANHSRTVSPVQRRLLNGYAELAASESDDCAFYHTVLCQIGLPYRRSHPGQRQWERRNGRATLMIGAGQVIDPRSGHFVDVPLPWGSRARLVLLHVTTEAIRTQSPKVHVGNSLTAFLRSLIGRSPNSRDIVRFKDQLTSLAAATIRIAIVAPNRTHAAQMNGHFIHAFDVWSGNGSAGRAKWPREVELSPEFYRTLDARCVPMDTRALRCLAHSALALDLYAWLSQRLPRIQDPKGQFVAWGVLWQQFGSGFQRCRDFRREFIEVLRQVTAVYPAAKIEEKFGSNDRPEGLQLYPSAPPIARLG